MTSSPAFNCSNIVLDWGKSTIGPSATCLNAPVAMASKSAAQPAGRCSIMCECNPRVLPFSRTQSALSGCPRCARLARSGKPLTEEMRRAWADERPIEDVARADRTATWRCPGCQRLWEGPIRERFGKGLTCAACKFAAPRPHLRKRAPSAIMRADWAEEFPIEKVLHKQRCRWVCRGREKPCGHHWEARFDNRLRGDGCPACAGHLPINAATAAQTRQERATRAMRFVAGGATFAEAARHLGVTRATLGNWARDGLLPKTPGGCLRRCARLGLAPLLGDPPPGRTKREAFTEVVRKLQALVRAGTTIAAAARSLGVRPGTAYNWRVLGLLPLPPEQGDA